MYKFCRSLDCRIEIHTSSINNIVGAPTYTFSKGSAFAVIYWTLRQVLYLVILKTWKDAVTYSSARREISPYKQFATTGWRRAHMFLINIPSRSPEMPLPWFWQLKLSNLYFAGISRLAWSKMRGKLSYLPETGMSWK